MNGAGLHGSMLPPDKLESDVSFFHFDSLLVLGHTLRLCSQFDKKYLGFEMHRVPEYVSYTQICVG